MFLWGTDEEKAYLKRLEAAFNSLIKRLEDFQHDWDGWDPVWRLYFRDRKKRWNRIIASYYNGDYFVSCLYGGFLSQYWEWKIKPGEYCRENENGFHDGNEWPTVEVLEDAMRYLDEVEKDWVGAYRRLERDWPKNRREGTVPRAVLHRYIPNFPRVNELAGEDNVRYFCELVESHYYTGRYDRNKRFYREEMTAGDYLELCRIGLGAIDAEKGAKRKKTGAEYYAKNSYNFSFGTILKVPADSREEFRKWIKEEEPYGWHDGGHQFWIGPGRIHLAVYLDAPEGEEKDWYKLSLSACFSSASYNLVKMAVAFHKAGVHIPLADYKEIREAMLAEDTLAIVPEGGDTRYAGHNGAYESIWLSEIGRRYVNIRDFVQWKPMPILRPKSAKYSPIPKIEGDVVVK